MQRTSTESFIPQSLESLYNIRIKVGDKTVADAEDVVLRHWQDVLLDTETIAVLKLTKWQLREIFSLI